MEVRWLPKFELVEPQLTLGDLKPGDFFYQKKFTTEVIYVVVNVVDYLRVAELQDDAVLVMCLSNSTSVPENNGALVPPVLCAFSRCTSVEKVQATLEVSE